MTTRVPLPVLAPPGLKPCTECGRCCTYVSVGINEPRTVRFASDVLWYLYHEHVSVYRDGDGDWSVVFETRCRNLRPDLLCSVYEDRPAICRDFDNTSCEVNSPEGGLSFETPQPFLDWLRAERPAVFRRLAARFVPPALRPGGAEARPPSPSRPETPRARRVAS